MVHLLLKCGADVTSRDVQKWTPLMHAVAGGHIPVRKHWIFKAVVTPASLFPCLTCLFVRLSDCLFLLLLFVCEVLSLSFVILARCF